MLKNLLKCLLPLLLMQTALAVESIGLNGPWVNTYVASPAVHSACIDTLIQSGGATYRIPIEAGDAFLTGVWDINQKALHEFIAFKLADKKLKVDLILTSVIPNKSYYRKVYWNYHKNDPDKINDPIWQDWAKADAHIWSNWSLYYHTRLNLDVAFWPELRRIYNEIITIYANAYWRVGLRWQDYGMIEGLNEIAWVINSEVPTRPEIPYGTFAPWVSRFYDYIFCSFESIDLKGAILLGGCYENETKVGREQELRTGDGFFKIRLDAETVHIYIPYDAGVTKTTWAGRFYTAFVDFLVSYDTIYPNRTNVKFAVTEFGSIDIPLELRMSYLVAAAKKINSHSRAIHSFGYTTATTGIHGDQFGIRPWSSISTPIN